VRERVEPLELRRALMRFLTDFSHRPNGAVVGRTTFEPHERDGARLFRDRCEACHAARLSADDATTRVAFEQWEPMILREASPIVWGSVGYKKTGIIPYVHPDGARTPSLRRLYKKHPYFTNGSARSIDDVLDAVRFTPSETFHAQAPPGAESLDTAGKRALRAFLELL
jgi:cytochrome c peroxidase